MSTSANLQNSSVPQSNLLNEEIWKPLRDFPDYHVSNLGRVKSFKGKKVKILKPCPNSRGYYSVGLSVNKVITTIRVHQLVAIAFLNHKRDGQVWVVNHKNSIQTDNRLGNLEVITQRENASKKRVKSSSKYIGVIRNKKTKKWESSIRFPGGRKYLGSFDNELDAHHAYQKALKEILKDYPKRQ